MKQFAIQRKTQNKALYRDGHTPHWTEHQDEATLFEFETMAVLTAFSIGLSDTEFEIVRFDA